MSAVNGLHKCDSSFPAYSHDLPEKLVCQPATQRCSLNQCDECQDGKGFRALDSPDAEPEKLETCWPVWKKDSQEKLCKVIEGGTVEELKEYICSILPVFLKDCYIKRNQAATYEEMRKAAASESHDQTHALLQIEYFKNYTCSFQDEIQSAHWNQSQVSLFTSALCHSGRIHSKVTASDHLVHSKEILLAFIDSILEDLPPVITTVSIWSDGPSFQFKNKYIAAALASLQQKHGKTIHWNYFATFHGKGPVDGIGGAVKRHVWEVVKSRKCIVTNASSFVKAAADMPRVEVVSMSKAEIAEHNEALGLDACLHLLQL